MTHVYYYRIRRYHVGDEPYSVEQGEIVEEGRDTKGGVYFQECIDMFKEYEQKDDFSYSIEIIDSRMID
jgi:hypothetical protein